MANIDPLVPRNVVLDMKPLEFTIGDANFAGVHSNPRLWWDTFSIFGQDIAQHLFAYDGGQVATDVTAVTAAVNLVSFRLAGPQAAADCEVVVGCALSPTMKETLETLVSDVQQSKASDYTIKFGACNTAQEFKNDEVWGMICDLSSLCLTIISADEFNLDFEKVGFLGGSTAKADYYKLTFSGVMIDKENFTNTSIACEHGDSTAKGEYVLQSIDSSAVA